MNLTVFLTVAIFLTFSHLSLLKAGGTADNTALSQNAVESALSPPEQTQCTRYVEPATCDDEVTSKFHEFVNHLEDGIKDMAHDVKENVEDWMNKHKMRLLVKAAQVIRKAVHKYRYLVVNLTWPWFRKRVNVLLEKVSTCVGYASLQDVPVNDVDMKKCHPKRTSMKLIMTTTFSSQINVHKVKSWLPCTKKYFAQEKLGVSSEEQELTPEEKEEMQKEMEAAKKEEIQGATPVNNAALKRKKRGVQLIAEQSMQESVERYPNSPLHRKKRMTGADGAVIYVGTMPLQEFLLMMIPITAVVVVCTVGGLVTIRSQKRRANRYKRFADDILISTANVNQTLLPED